jgi:hypothetical protein
MKTKKENKLYSKLIKYCKHKLPYLICEFCLKEKK